MWKSVVLALLKLLREKKEFVGKDIPGLLRFGEASSIHSLAQQGNSSGSGDTEKEAPALALPRQLLRTGV